MKLRQNVQPEKVWFTNEHGNMCFGEPDFVIFEIVPEGKLDLLIKFWGCGIHRSSTIEEAKQYIEQYLAQ